MARTRFIPDRGLTVRMATTMVLLALVYAAFVVALLWAGMPWWLVLLVVGGVAFVASAAQDVFVVGKFRPVFIVSGIIIEHVMPDRAVRIARVGRGVSRAGIEPETNDFEFVLRNLSSAVPFFHEFEEPA